MTSGTARTAVILGTGGFAIELHGLLVDAEFEVHGFIGPEPGAALPARWIGPDESVDSVAAGTRLYIAIGDPATRQRLSDWLASRSRPASGFVHPRAWIASSATIADETIIYPNSTVHAAVRLGRGVLVNSNVTIGHETVVGAFSNLNPGVALGGRVRIAERTYVGIGARTIENLAIGENVTIGAGATVVADIVEAGTYVGTPARRLPPRTGTGR